MGRAPQKMWTSATQQARVKPVQMRRHERRVHETTHSTTHSSSQVCTIPLPSTCVHWKHPEIRRACPCDAVTFVRRHNNGIARFPDEMLWNTGRSSTSSRSRRARSRRSSPRNETNIHRTPLASAFPQLQCRRHRIHRLPLFRHGKSCLQMLRRPAEGCIAPSRHEHVVRPATQLGRCCHLLGHRPGPQFPSECAASALAFSHAHLSKASEVRTSSCTSTEQPRRTMNENNTLGMDSSNELKNALCIGVCTERQVLNAAADINTLARRNLDVTHAHRHGVKALALFLRVSTCGPDLNTLPSGEHMVADSSSHTVRWKQDKVLFVAAPDSKRLSEQYARTGASVSSATMSTIKPKGTSSDAPPVSIPGVANNTAGPGSCISALDIVFKLEKSNVCATGHV